MAGTVLRFDFKLFLINWSIAVVVSAVLRLADAPNLYISSFKDSDKSYLDFGVIRFSL